MIKPCIFTVPHSVDIRLDILFIYRRSIKMSNYSKTKTY